MKLSSPQKKVMKRFVEHRWLSAYELQASMATLNALVSMGLLERRGVGSLGSTFSPRTTVEYRRLTILLSESEPKKEE